MPKRGSNQNQSHPTLVRRSSRFVHPAEPEKSEDPNTYKRKLRKCQVRRSPYAVLALAAPPMQNPSIPKAPNPNPDRISKKFSKLRQDLSHRFDEVSGLRRSPRLNSGVDGFTRHGHSSKLSSSRFVEKAVAGKVKTFTEKGFRSTAAIPTTPSPDPDKISKKSLNFGNDLVKPAVGVRRSPRLNNGVHEFTRHKQSSKFYSDEIVDKVRKKKKKKSKCEEKISGSNREKGAVEVEKENENAVIVDKVKKKKNKSKREDKTACSDREKGAVAVEKEKEKVVVVVADDLVKKSKREDKAATLNREKGALEVEKEKGNVVDKVKNKNKSKCEDKTAVSNREKGAVAVEKEKEKLFSVVHKLKNKKNSKRGDKAHGSDRERGAETVEKEEVVEKERKRKRSCSGSLHGHSNGQLISDYGNNKIPYCADRTEKRCMVTEVNGRKNEMAEISSEENANVSERIVCAGLKALASNGDGKESVSSARKVEIRVKRMRMPCTNGNAVLQGWTKEQEVALQRAYYASKPTPHFWKNVAKLVPGKSAQECFDKTNSDHVTPPQVPAQSRAKKISSVSIEQFSLSASKLLEPGGAKTKRFKQRGQGGWKSIRKLLQRNCLVNEENGADLFSILEPDVDISANVPPNASPTISTPAHQNAADGLLIKCQEGYSGKKGQKSKFSSSSLTPIVSPPVLKPVKNRVLHEKYIDQLHSRDAKRKAESKRGTRSGKENHETLPIENVGGVRVAKNNLLSKARDAIYELKHLHEDAVVNSDLEDDGIEVGDADDDLEL